MFIVNPVTVLLIALLALTGESLGNKEYLIFPSRKITKQETDDTFLYLCLYAGGQDNVDTTVLQPSSSSALYLGRNYPNGGRRLPEEPGLRRQG